MMTLYSRADDARCHRVRFVLAEKALDVRIVETDPSRPPEDLIDLNPYQTVPTLVDRELVVYEPDIICEYLDERFPHPSLTPTDPGARAQARVALKRIEHDWYAVADGLESRRGHRPPRTRPGPQDAAPKACWPPSRCFACGRGSCPTISRSSTPPSPRSCGACSAGKWISRRSPRRRRKSSATPRGCSRGPRSAHSLSDVERNMRSLEVERSMRARHAY